MTRKKAVGGATGRYLLRHILRSPGKSLLCLALAAAFLLGLTLIRVSIIRSENELEELYLNTTVTVEILKNTSAQIYGAGGAPESGFVYRETVDKLMNTGFLSHRYVESTKRAKSLVRVDAQGKPVEDGAFGFYSESQLRGVEYPREFLALRGVAGEITYFDGWDESVFLQDWDDWKRQNEATGRLYWVYPVVVSQGLYDELQPEEGDLVQVSIEIQDPQDYTQTTLVTTDLTVVGIHPGDMATLLLPVNALRRVKGVDLNYDRVLLTIDPAKNRQLDEFRPLAANLIAGGGPVPLRAVYNDQELRQAVIPMEQVISFMKALYPVTLALSALVAAGVAVLLTLMSAKDAAILRVLGNSKTRCRAILCLQTALVCIVGLAAGYPGAAVMARIMVPAAADGLMLPALGQAGLYLLFTLLGAVGTSAAMTVKNPLELLQVKE